MVYKSLTKQQWNSLPSYLLVITIGAWTSPDKVYFDDLATCQRFKDRFEAIPATGPKNIVATCIPVEQTKG